MNQALYWVCLYMLSYLILVTVLQDRYYVPVFNTYEKQDSEELSNLVKVTQPISGRVGI